MEQIIEQLKVICLAAEASNAKSKDLIKQYEQKLAELDSREKAIEEKEAELIEREEAVADIENVVLLREQLAERVEQLAQREESINNAQAAERKELDKMKKQNEADAADLKIKQGELTRDWAEFKKEKDEYKTKVLAGITEKQLG